MKIKEFSPLDFSKLEAQWKELQKGTEMTCFQTYEWYKIINTHFIAEKKKSLFRFGTYVLVSDDNDKPLLIAPIQVIKRGFYFKGVGLRKGFYFIGRQGFSDYLNFIYKEIKQEYLSAIFEYLKSNYSLNFFCFENVSENTDAYRILNDAFNCSRFDSLCMTLPLADDFETYRKSLSKSTRQNIRTAFNRSAKDNIELSYEIRTSIDGETADTLMAIREQRLGKKVSDTNSNLSKKAKLYNSGRNFIVNFASEPVDVMKEVKNCWCFIARCNGEIGAFFYSLYKPENKTVYLLLAGVEKKYEWYSPGVTQLYKYMEDEINSGKKSVDVIDLTRGNEKYKYQLKSKELVTSQFDFSI